MIDSNSRLTLILISKNILKTFIGIFIILSISSCTYDKSLIYKKNYQPGKNSLLGLNGFYFNEIKSTNTSEYPRIFIHPIFFYADGSVIYMGAVENNLINKTIADNPKVWGYWGNYKISNDTIWVETIGSYGGSFHHVRFIKMGVIKKDTINFFQEIDRKGKTRELNEIIQFQNSSVKPDSTENWIRKKKKYN